MTSTRLGIAAQKREQIAFLNYRRALTPVPAAGSECHIQQVAIKTAMPLITIPQIVDF
jgi:hypothetical protein